MKNKIDSLRPSAWVDVRSNLNSIHDALNMLDAQKSFDLNSMINLISARIKQFIKV